jgi:hypothetical protein
VSNRKVNCWPKRPTRILAVLLTAPLLTALGGYARATWFKTRSEGLFEDLKVLRVGVSGFDDAKRLADKYSKHLIVESTSCVPKECRFGIRLMKMPLLYVGACCDMDFDFPRKLGIRPSSVVAQVSVHDGFVTSTSFSVDYRTGRGEWIGAISKAISSFGLLDKFENPSLQLHPNFAVKVGSITTIGGGAFIAAAYTPQATSGERSVVSDVRLSCLTKVPDCRDRSDVMPQAARAYASDLEWTVMNSSWTLRDQLEKELHEKYGSPPWNAATSF